MTFNVMTLRNVHIVGLEEYEWQLKLIYKKKIHLILKIWHLGLIFKKITRLYVIFT